MKLLDNFKYYNRVKKLNGILQFLLIVLLIFGFQSLLPYYQIRFDFSKNHQNSFHNETRAFLKTLQEPLEMFLLKDSKQPDESFQKNFKRLLLALRIELSKNRKSLNFKEIDALKSPKDLLQFQEHCKVDASSGLFIAMGSRNLLIPFDSFYKNKTFVGENCLLNALRKLTSSPKVIYWITGHNEINGQDVHPNKGGSTAHQNLNQFYCTIHYLDTCNSIPSDADIIAIFGPQLPFLPQECSSIKDFLHRRHGNIWLCLHPIYEHGLNDFLNTIGINCDSNLLLDNSADFLSSDGDLIIRRFNQHTIVQSLIQKNLGLVFGLTTTLNIKDGPQTSSCLLSSESSWTKPSKNLKNLTFDPQRDTLGPKNLCAVYTSHTSNQFDLKIPQGKIVVVSCADWLDNGHFQSLGNRTFFQSIYHFLSEESLEMVPDMIDHDNSGKLIIPQQKFYLLILNFLILPFIFLIGGFMTTIIRKE